MGFAGSDRVEPGSTDASTFLEFLAALASGELIDGAGEIPPGADDRGWFVDDAPSPLESFLSVDGDTFFFEGDDTPSVPGWPASDVHGLPENASESDEALLREAPTAAGTDAAVFSGDIGVPGDVIPPPDEPEKEIPVGDVIPAPGPEELGPFIADDGSVVDLQDLTDSIEFLLL